MNSDKSKRADSKTANIEEDKASNLESPLEKFPRVAEIKVMGKNESEFESVITQFVGTLVADTAILGQTTRESSGGKFVSVTLNLYVDSKRQLIDIYSQLRDRDDVHYLL